VTLLDPKYLHHHTRGRKMRLQAMRGGAVKFLAKPLDGTILLERVQVALEN
jgi:FixJ family two-component response regulator